MIDPLRVLLLPLELTPNCVLDKLDHVLDAALFVGEKVHERVR